MVNMKQTTIIYAVKINFEDSIFQILCFHTQVVLIDSYNLLNFN